jgi:hypothetical protein
LSNEDISILISKRRIKKVERAFIQAWCTVFTTLELEKLRRRWIVEPHLNDYQESKVKHAYATFPLSLIETAILAVLQEGAMVTDFPFYFGQFPLAEEAQPFYGFAVEGDQGLEYYVLITAPTGGRKLPECAQILTWCIAQASGGSASQGVADTCIDNIRVAAPWSLVGAAICTYRSICCNLGITFNEAETNTELENMLRHRRPWE